MAKTGERAQRELQRRWRAMFETLHRGGEVAPSERLRAEGWMEALVLLEVASEDELQAALAACYRDCFGRALAPDWKELFPFPQIPGFGCRAPVFPSTAD